MDKNHLSPYANICQSREDRLNKSKIYKVRPPQPVSCPCGKCFGYGCRIVLISNSRALLRLEFTGLHLSTREYEQLGNWDSFLNLNIFFQCIHFQLSRHSLRTAQYMTMSLSLTNKKIATKTITMTMTNIFKEHL